MPPTKTSPFPLTAKEKEVLQFIESFVQERGIAPTFQDVPRSANRLKTSF